jgi:hypothetical protein
VRAIIFPAVFVLYCGGVLSVAFLFEIAVSWSVVLVCFLTRTNLKGKKCQVPFSLMHHFRTVFCWQTFMKDPPDERISKLFRMPLGS